LPVPETDTGGEVENTKGREKEKKKEKKSKEKKGRKKIDKIGIFEKIFY